MSENSSESNESNPKLKPTNTEPAYTLGKGMAEHIEAASQPGGKLLNPGAQAVETMKKASTDSQHAFVQGIVDKLMESG